MNPIRRSLLVVAASGGSMAMAATASDSGELKLRALLESRRAASDPAAPPRAPLPAQRAVERDEYLLAGEAALSALDLSAALRAFEAAAAISHAADSELGLVRTYLQGGEYRRALAFGAHTAGAHREVAGGAGLYAWLLHLGGQPAPARRLLDEAQARQPDHPQLLALRRAMESPAPRALGPMLQAPARLAPYGSTAGLTRRSRVVCTGLLIDQGKAVLAPTRPLGGGRLWARNGVGQLTELVLERRLRDTGLVRLRALRPLPPEHAYRLPAREPFPGSAAFAIEQVAAADANPGWPVLRSGFLGAPIGTSSSRLLGIDMPPGPRGGPVFDVGGRLLGVALAGDRSPDHLVSAIRLREWMGTMAAGDTVPLSEVERVPSDLIYERTLFSTLQIISA